MTEWVSRYQRGQVWHELRQLGGAVRLPDHAADGRGARTPGMAGEANRRRAHDVVEVQGSRYPGSSIRTYFEDELEGWQDDPDTAGPFSLPVACTDGLIRWEAATMPFVSSRLAAGLLPL